MNEIVDRVAKAIFIARHPRLATLDELPAEEFWPDNIASITNGPPFIAEGYQAMARAALLAMREPTEQMLEVMDDNVGAAYEAMWKITIDAILKD